MSLNARIPLEMYHPKENKMLKFKLKRRLGLRGWRWYAAIIGANGEIMFASEGIVNKGDALQSIRQVKRLAREAPIELEPEIRK